MKIKALGFTCGIMWALFVMWSVIICMIGVGDAPFNFVDQFYLGWLTPNFAGLILGTVMALVDGFVAGALFAWLYGLFARS